jgi:hypothetical protein
MIGSGRIKITLTDEISDEELATTADSFSILTLGRALQNENIQFPQSGHTLLAFRLINSIAATSFDTAVFWAARLSPLFAASSFARLPTISATSPIIAIRWHCKSPSNFQIRLADYLKKRYL